MASDTAKGSKKVKINADMAIDLKDKSNYKISESDEISTQTAELSRIIQRRYKQEASNEMAVWKKKLMMCECVILFPT